MRLIDADALEKEIEKNMENGFPANENLSLYAISCIAHAPTACDINAIISELKDLIKTVDEMGCPTLQFRQALGIIYHHTRGNKE